MRESTLGIQARTESGVIVVEGGTDPVRVHSVNEANLGLGESSTIDGERVDSHVPQGDSVQSSLGEDDEGTMNGFVVEEQSTDVHASGVLVLGSLISEISSYHTENGAIPRTEGVGDSVALRIRSKSEVTRCIHSHSLSPVRVDRSSVPAIQPCLWVDTVLLQFLLEPPLHDLVVRLDECVFSGQTSMCSAGVADPLALDDVQRGAGAAVAVYWA